MPGRDDREDQHEDPDVEMVDGRYSQPQTLHPLLES
jgi:hypothetical protein